MPGLERTRQGDRHGRQEFVDQARRQGFGLVDQDELLALHRHIVGDEGDDRHGDAGLAGLGQGEGPLLAVDDPGGALAFRPNGYGEFAAAHQVVLAGGAARRFEADLGGEGEDDGVREEDRTLAEELGDLRDVGLDLPTLKALEMAVAAAQAADVGNLGHLMAR